MKKPGTIMIGTWPTPEKPVPIEIPQFLMREFAKETKVIAKQLNTVGFTISGTLLKKMAKDPKTYSNIKRKFDLILVPK